jgi:hypothetical protein
MSLPPTRRASRRWAYEFWPEALEGDDPAGVARHAGVPILVTENGIGTATTPSASSTSSALQGVASCSTTSMRGYI